MRLGDRERSVLKVLELNADQSMLEIAKRSGLRAHSVAYCIAKLREEGILGPRRASINTYRLGFSDFHFVFSLATGNSGNQRKFVSTLSAAPKVTWFAEIGGTHQFAMSLRVRQVHEALDFMTSLRKQFPNFIRSQELSIVSSIASYGRRYLYGTKKLEENFKNSALGPIISSLDSTDYKILSGLSEIAHSSERELAQQIGIPFSTLRRRIGALEKNQVINGYYHHLDVLKLGYQVYKILIFTRTQDLTFQKQLEQFAASEPNVIHYLESLGSWQNEFVIEVQEAVEASRLANKVRERFDAQIDAVHVVPIFQYFKAATFPSGLIEGASES